MSGDTEKREDGDAGEEGRRRKREKERGRGRKGEKEGGEHVVREGAVYRKASVVVWCVRGLVTLLAHVRMCTSASERLRGGTCE